MSSPGHKSDAGFFPPLFHGTIYCSFGQPLNSKCIQKLVFWKKKFHMVKKSVSFNTLMTNMHPSLEYNFSFSFKNYLMEWKAKCPRWPLITGKPLRYDGFIVSKLYWGGGIWIPYLESIVIIGVSFDDKAPKEKNTKYKVKPITKGKSLMIVYRPCLIRDENIIFQRS